MEEEKDTESSAIAFSSILFPIVIVVFGVLAASGVKTSSSDWFGGEKILTFLIGLFVACLCSVGLSIVSFVLKERLAWISLFLAVPSGLALGFVGLMFLSGA